ncbi:hypothetical protein RRG08_057342 [Elysia crispata]|uniref:Uncharacterized protein n=1 Tax=Elysia crispata TaxID=231223 RepID=A0AAE0YJG4_9GAST|nr:hypothetical protein RRG08_057342 [Elysia crispata]
MTTPPSKARGVFLPLRGKDPPRELKLNWLSRGNTPKGVLPNPSVGHAHLVEDRGRGLDEVPDRSSFLVKPLGRRAVTRGIVLPGVQPTFPPKARFLLFPRRGKRPPPLRGGSRWPSHLGRETRKDQNPRAKRGDFDISQAKLSTGESLPRFAINNRKGLTRPKTPPKPSLRATLKNTPRFAQACVPPEGGRDHLVASCRKGKGSPGRGGMPRANPKSPPS